MATTETTMAGEERAARGEGEKDLGAVQGVLTHPATSVAARWLAGLGWVGARVRALGRPPARREVDERPQLLGWAALCAHRAQWNST